MMIGGKRVSSYASFRPPSFWIKNGIALTCIFLLQMSDIYVQEPPCEGKVCLETTVGEIDVELWSRECPKACRNFIQLCLEG